ncbi:MAG: long-chain fatty acid--CoA ligase [Sandaracinaceae bacterium]|nr:long-chain fatty acid--CoA ligase [Sandaracinaceae bacterium]
MTQRKTLVDQLEGWAKKRPDRQAIATKVDGSWQTLTWSEYWTAAREVAKGLIALGHEVGDCVAIVGNNRSEWVLCQFGIMSARGVPAPIYTTNTDEQTAYIVSHCKAKIAICDDRVQLDKYLRCIEAGLMSVDKIVTMDAIGSSDERVMSLEALRALGREQDDAALDERLEDLTEDETALLIYTSGTTGVPKAVTLEHGGMVMIGEAIIERMPPFAEEGVYRSVSYLPLCHVAEQLFTNFMHLATGGQVFFCPDLKLIKDYLVDVRPTLFLGVPRVWEKFQAALEAKLADTGGLKGWLVGWARAKELESFKQEVATGRPVTGFMRSQAQKILGGVREKLGMDQIVAAATGAAPISVGTLEFFASLGIVVYEGFGMSETTGVATCGTYGKPRFGTVGKALQGVTIKIADDEEILLKGRNMTRGYLHMPDKTEELLDADGWLHTGDLGALDDEGNLKITGRKKDLIITAGGKNVAPAEMEAHIKQIAGVGQAVVVGDRQPYLSALITLDPESLPELTSRLGIADEGLEKVSKSDAVRKYLTDQIEAECNAKVARYQTIKKFEVLPVEFSVEGDELTPTMKIKRNVVNKKYASNIDALYASPEGKAAAAPAE